MIEIKEIGNKEIWENFLLDCREKTFLSSWNWGEFNKMMGNKIWRLGIYGNEQRTVNSEQLISVALLVKIQAKRGTFLFVPHGPNIISNFQFPISKKEILSTLLEKLKDIAKKEGANFIRIAPIWPARRSLSEGGEKNEENIMLFKELRFKDAPIHMHPELTWELDITLPEEEILTKMRKTTRYLIRQAQKNEDIKIIQTQKIEDIEEFNKLYQETVDRHHFAPFSLDYLKNEFSAFIKDNQIAIFLGKYKGELVSSGIFIFWQGIGFYHHGASSIAYPKIPVSYLLQWEAIKEAKKRGCERFNFWGIADQNQKSKTELSFMRARGKKRTKFSSPIKNQKFEMKRHPWSGLTLFKMGFGGYKKEYVKTQDFPISLKYWFTYIFEKLRKQKRGL